ncbi:hypothetical protein [Aeromicrobium sp. CTD01-1L150]|uniref:hypothetical protein n=1 Tax=Aeromicrobium sp. CTD01-1L150 TaxID=3341830 RepID=UPI0035BF2F6C
MLSAALTSSAAGVSSSVLATDGIIVMAIPAFVPAVLLVGIVLYIARKDRMDELEETTTAGSGAEDVPPASPGETNHAGVDRGGERSPDAR